jgi:hypothetical protein
VIGLSQILWGSKLENNRNQLAARFRFLSTEFNEARKLPSDRIDQVVFQLQLKANKLTSIAWHQGLLAHLESLNSNNLVGGNCYDVFLFNRLAGYSGVSVHRETCPEFDCDGNEYERDVDFYSLGGGLLSQDGFVLNDQILLGCNLTDEEIRQAQRENMFHILGKYSQACLAIAKIIEGAGVNESHDRTDGLYREELCLVWGGRRFDWLTETMMDALELMVKRYPEKVRPNEMEHKLGRLPEGGFKKVFKTNRGGKSSTHPVAKLIGGRSPEGWFLTK